MELVKLLGALGVQLTFKVIHGDIHGNLVGGALEPWNFMTFHSVGNGIIIPIDEVQYFSEG